MRESLRLLSPNELRSLASAFRTGRICVPCSPASLACYVSEPTLDQITAAIRGDVYSWVLICGDCIRSGSSRGCSIQYSEARRCRSTSDEWTANGRISNVAKRVWLLVTYFEMPARAC